jgi:mono/diheme cytochrome c family protein
MRSAFGLAVLFAATALADPPKLPPAATGRVDFGRDVWPILNQNCVKCHSAEKRKGGFSLADGESMLAGSNSGKVVLAGKSAESRLIHVVAGADAETRMPPEGPALTSAQVGILRRWIDDGAKWDSPAVTAGAKAKSTHWPFQPIAVPPLPQVKNRTWARNGIDLFVLARLEKEGVAPSPEADRVTLIRRLSLDLIGLPPTPDEVRAFVDDRAAGAYERLVERLLNSPHYGERWGRHWLDAARYADSDGYEKDTGRPWAWRYRDYVIHALNVDRPFDRFTIEQLAGDLLPGSTIEQKIATGFHRNTLTNKEGGVDAEEFRVAAVMDRVSTTGKVFLGLTVGCCQCHDHKFDPLTQREFYQLFAYFNSDREFDIDAPLPGESEKVKERLAAHAKRRAELQKAVDDYAKGLTPDQAKTDAKLKQLRVAVTNHDKAAPTVAKAPTLAVGAARPTHIMIRGDFLRKGVEVTPGTPAVLTAPAATPPAATRLDLAKWIVEPANPLTRRVLVNWVWQKYFGRGIVATAEDFGTQGEKPSHPELLDWLASRVLEQNWSLKALHRLIVNSATYRQSSKYRPELKDRDPLNVLLARQNRLRLEAEVVRDTALASSGLLHRAVGGPSVRPPQPAGVSELTYAGAAKWVESKGADRYRRGLYVWFQRTSPYPTLMTFDAPDSNVCTVRRERSNTPLQALTLLNDVVFVEAAQALAKRVQDEMPNEAPSFRLDRMMEYAFGREPTDDERKKLLRLYDEFRSLAASSPAEAAKLPGDHRPARSRPNEAAAWVGVARTLLNLDEFVTRE